MHDFFGTDYGKNGFFSYFILWIRYAFGIHSLISGVNYFYPFLPLPVGESPLGPFVSAMIDAGLYDCIKVVEVLVGLCLVFNKFVPLAVVLEFPISYSIFHLSVFVDGGSRPMFTGPRELFYNSVLLIAYMGYYIDMLKVNAELQPLWTQVERIKQVMR